MLPYWRDGGTWVCLEELLSLSTQGLSGYLLCIGGRACQWDPWWHLGPNFLLEGQCPVCTLRWGFLEFQVLVVNDHVWFCQCWATDATLGGRLPRYPHLSSNRLPWPSVIIRPVRSHGRNSVQLVVLQRDSSLISRGQESNLGLSASEASSLPIQLRPAYLCILPCWWSQHDGLLKDRYTILGFSSLIQKDMLK